MIDLEESRREASELEEKLNQLTSSFNINEIKKEAEELEVKTLQDGFWNDSSTSNHIIKQIKSLKSKIKRVDELQNLMSNINDSFELMELEKDEDLEKELLGYISRLTHQIEKFEIELLLSGKFDRNNAIITLHPGAGGTESCDWASMLYRMYTRWCEKNNKKIELLDYQDGDTAGIKSVSFIVHGLNFDCEFYGKMQELLDDRRLRGFLLIHQSFLININHIITYEYNSVEMTGGVILTISKSNRKDVRRKILEYSADKIRKKE